MEAVGVTVVPFARLDFVPVELRLALRFPPFFTGLSSSLGCTLTIQLKIGRLQKDIHHHYCKYSKLLGCCATFYSCCSQ